MDPTLITPKTSAAELQVRELIEKGEVKKAGKALAQIMNNAVRQNDNETLRRLLPVAQELRERGDARSRVMVWSTITQLGKLEKLNTGSTALSNGPREAEVMFTGTSRDKGRNARITLYSDRIERVKEHKFASLSKTREDLEMTPVKHITSIRARKDDFLHTKVTVFASGNNIDFTFRHHDAQQFHDKLQELLLNHDQVSSPSTAQPTPASSPDAIDQLKKLAELRDEGILTTEEFDAKKTELLARL